eukprot:5458830-Prymnesium_polylepis.1
MARETTASTSASCSCCPALAPVAVASGGGASAARLGSKGRQRWRRAAPSSGSRSRWQKVLEQRRMSRRAAPTAPTELKRPAKASAAGCGCSESHAGSHRRMNERRAPTAPQRRSGRSCGSS